MFFMLLNQRREAEQQRLRKIRCHQVNAEQGAAFTFAFVMVSSHEVTASSPFPRQRDLGSPLSPFTHWSQAALSEGFGQL